MFFLRSPSLKDLGLCLCLSDSVGILHPGSQNVCTGVLWRQKCFDTRVRFPHPIYKSFPGDNVGNLVRIADTRAIDNPFHSVYSLWVESSSCWSSNIESWPLC